jgi:hypothetical protein
MSKHARIRSPWRRLILSLCLAGLGLVNRLDSRRARVHWIGRYRRPRRRERLLFLLMFLISMLTLSVRQFLFWSVMWGGVMAIFLNLNVIYWLLPRKRAHWVR